VSNCCAHKNPSGRTQDEEPPENSERANKENSATTADTSEVAHSRDSCVALRAVALQKGIDKTVRAVLRFLDKLLKEYAQALCDERGVRIHLNQWRCPFPLANSTRRVLLRRRGKLKFKSKTWFPLSNNVASMI